MIVFGIIIISLFVHKSSSRYVGERCVINQSNQIGTCRLSTECPDVYKLLRCKNISPTTCGFEGFDPIVCCPNDGVDLKGCSASSNTPIGQRISQIKCDETKVCKPRILAIVGGTDALYGEFPHMAAIGWPRADGSGYGWDCGGSLISENFILTAAHCTNSREASYSSATPTMVRLGAYNISEITDDVQDIRIERIISHPEYRAPSKYHDIALIKLENNARLGGKVNPICLWQSTTFDSNTIQIPIATGWGNIAYGTTASDILQKVYLNFIDQTTCVNVYGTNRRRLNRGVIPEQLCVGVLGGGKDTCQGDSGGPLQIPDSNYSCNNYHLVGITSFGNGCGGVNTPALYTRVSSYIDWIESVVWPRK